MATTLASLEAAARKPLNEPVAAFWSSSELIEHLNRAIQDLWRALSDTFQDYFLTIDTTNVSIAASAYTLTGVPADLSILRGIEPRSLSSYPHLKFVAKDYMHPDFQAARAATSIDPATGGTIYFCQHGSAGPVAAPTIRVAPALSSALTLTLVYMPTLSSYSSTANNPIPGHSDEALIDWCVAHALAKSSPTGQPDPGWMAKYEAEKAKLIVALTPRQTQDEDYAEALFETYWQ